MKVRVELKREDRLDIIEQRQVADSEMITAINKQIVADGEAIIELFNLVQELFERVIKIEESVKR
jgi:uncharacterized coiled-coil protein SlyX